MWSFETTKPLSFHYELQSQRYAVNGDYCSNTPRFQTKDSLQVMHRFSKLDSSIRIEPSKKEFEETLRIDPRNFEEYERFCSKEKELAGADWADNVASISFFEGNIHAEISLSETSYDEFFRGLTFYDPDLHVFCVTLDFVGFGQARPVKDFVEGKNVFAGVSGIGFVFRELGDAQ